MRDLRIITRGTLLLAAALTALVMSSGCTRADSQEDAIAESGIQEITITSKEYFFVAPDTIDAGMTTIHLANTADELHHVQLIRFAEGRTLADLEAYMTANPGARVPEWATFVGGPNSPVPGGHSQATINLEPGNYGLVCLIPSPGDGVAHVMKGMSRALVVRPAAGPQAAEPTSDVVMRLADYDFQIEGEIKSGQRVIRVENTADQPHEVLLVQLAPGKTIEEVAAWAEKMQGPPPGAPLGGTSLITRGGVNFVTAQFEPGEYGLICFVPDAKDGKPHLMHGMMKQFTVS